MLLEIEAAVFQVDDHLPVARLLFMVAEQRHEWRPSLAAADAAGRFVATNLPHTRALAELVAKSLVEAANPAPAHPAPIRVPAAELAQLVQDLELPAVLLVEDAVTEECFLLAVAKAFDHRKILAAKERSWLEFAHAGGADRMGRFVAQRRVRYQRLGSARVAALMDSDRRWPGERTRRHAHAEAIAAQGCAVHVWQCRHVESYVPYAVWEHHFPDDHLKIGMLRDMRPDHRACLDVKNGLHRDHQRCPAVAAHYQDLPDEVRKQWWTGLKLASGTPLVPDELPLAESDFAALGDAAVAELRAVLAMIERIL